MVDNDNVEISYLKQKKKTIQYNNTIICEPFIYLTVAFTIARMYAQIP